MSSIPLLCNICPKQPEFSDISHLLTHIASKGHLSHYFNAQVRGRQDEPTRLKVEAYDLWFKKHCIDQLLSQRMSTKDTKNAKSAGKPRTQPNKPRPREKRTRTKPAIADTKPNSPLKSELAIDPQLSQSGLSPGLEPDHPYTLSQRMGPSRNPATVAHMSHWQTAEERGTRDSGLADDASASGKASDPGKEDPEPDLDLDYFKMFLRSPSQHVYPDPCDLQADVFDTPVKPKAPRRPLGKAVKWPWETHIGENLHDVSQPPELKGIKWPGMSLFDSADTDAQRLRNQKKDDSVVGYMEINSASIRPTEVIYWPGGKLKKSREITGDVASSSLDERTPPPKRRRKSHSHSRCPSGLTTMSRSGAPRVPPRSVLADLDPNKPRLAKKRGRKPKGSNNQEDVCNTDSPEQHALAQTSHRTSSMQSSRLTQTQFPLKRRSAFDIYRDPSEDRVPMGGHLNTPRICQTSLGGDRSPLALQQTDPFKVDGLPGPDTPTLRLWTHRTALHRNQPTLMPVLRARQDDEASKMAATAMDPSIIDYAPLRSTQRYFVITGNDEPQFYETMPPQMDFGGMAGPLHPGNTLNPLHPNIRAQRHHMSHRLSAAPQQNSPPHE